MNELLFNQPLDMIEEKFLSFCKAHDLHVFQIIKQEEYAHHVGLTMKPTHLVIFGNPKSGTGLMNQSDLMAFNLPIKILFIAYDQKTKVIYQDPYLFQGLNELDEHGNQVIKQMNELYNNIIHALK